MYPLLLENKFKSEYIYDFSFLIQQEKNILT